MKGTGRGRGRGGKGGRKGSGKGKEHAQAETSEANQKKENQTQTKKAFLLTNLVRAGNQMGGSGSWTLLGRALEGLVDENLELRPMSQRPADDMLRWNQYILKVIGKVPPDFDIVAFDSDSGSGNELPLTKRNGVLESAIELLRFAGGLVTQCYFDIDSVIHDSWPMILQSAILDFVDRQTVTDKLKLNLT